MQRSPVPRLSRASYGRQSGLHISPARQIGRKNFRYDDQNVKRASSPASSSAAPRDRTPSRDWMIKALLAVHFPERMFVEEVRFDASKLLAVIDLDAHVKVQRT